MILRFVFEISSLEFWKILKRRTILKRFITQTVYTRCTRINYKIVPVTSFNKYLHYGTNGNE